MNDSFQDGSSVCSFPFPASTAVQPSALSDCVIAVAAEGFSLPFDSSLSELVPPFQNTVHGLMENSGHLICSKYINNLLCPGNNTLAALPTTSLFFQLYLLKLSSSHSSDLHLSAAMWVSRLCSTQAGVTIK